MGFAEARARPGFVAALVVLAVLGAYLALPDAAEEGALAAETASDGEGDDDGTLRILTVVPTDPYPGAVLRIRHAGTLPAGTLRAYANRAELRVLARESGALVAELPRDQAAGVAKIRLGAKGPETALARPARTKPYYVRVKLPNTRKVFRNLLGGLALLLLGIAVTSRAAQKLTGIERARSIARLSQQRVVPPFVGAALGALTQSTSGPAGLLSALVTSGVLPVVPAALAQLAAPLGAALPMLLVTGLFEPSHGLVVLALGAALLALARDQRTTSLARLVLGGGFVLFGLQVMRPGLEPLACDPTLRGVLLSLSAPGLASTLALVAVGALLVAVLQGPLALVVVLLGVAQTSGSVGLAAPLALLSGTALGTALAGLVATPFGPRNVQLARLNLLCGALSGLVTALTLDLWVGLATALLGTPSAVQGVRLPLTELGRPLALAFALSQLAVCTGCALLVPALARLREAGARKPADVVRLNSALTVLRAQLGRAQALHASALAQLFDLALAGDRVRGQAAERSLADARALLEGALTSPAMALDDPEGQRFARAAVAALQLGRALETLLAQAQRLTDARIAAGAEALPSLSAADAALLSELRARLAEGLAALSDALVADAVDLDAACEREIVLNGLEARARRTLVTPRQPARLGVHLAVLLVVDACECTGNQLYRYLEALAGPLGPGALASAS